ncbi:hypothetical protein NL521_29750, partial [Klebsiella pneumoniae]|nr:hypothetical protein [Klebsiella pneumoniae]
GAIDQTTAVIFVGLTALLFIPFGGVKSVAWAATVQAWIFMVALWSIGICAIAYGFGGDVFGAAASVWDHTNSWFSYPGP